jgi:hypothetical protein
MQTHLSEKDVKGLLEQLKQDLRSLKENSLEQAFESATKHMPVYLKIVKSHIDQLAKVLELETHNHRNLENVGLAEPVIQLMQLFQALDEEDIQLLESLALEARNWPQAAATEQAKEIAKVVTEA